MDITCLTVFLDGRERFQPGDVCRNFDDEKGAYFVKNGWAKEGVDLTIGAPMSDVPAVDMTVHKATVGTGAANA